MKTLGNIIWHIPFLGFVSASLVYVLGLVLCATVVAAPIGLGLMEYGKFLFWPFGHEMVNKKDLNVEQNAAWKSYSRVISILYFPVGIVLAAFAVIQVIGLFISIIGIPAAIVVAKSLGTYINPVNKKCVRSSVADEIERIKAQEALQNSEL